jgi:hypothetical protein
LIAHIVEATNGLNYGKFLLARLDADELRMPTAMPEGNGTPWWRHGGLRRLNPHTTLVVDLQTGEGACFTLEGSGFHAHVDLERFRVHVCPLYEPFLGWLYDRGEFARGRGDLTTLPRYLELPDAPAAFAGHRRPGEG